MNKYKDIALLFKKWISGLFIIALVGFVAFGFLFALMYFISKLI